MTVKRSEWTILERTGRWAAALRLALHRANWPPSDMPRLVEIRRLDELNERLDTHSRGLLLVEVHRANFADVLPWLAAATRLYSRAHVAAIVASDVSCGVDRDAVADALREAGVSEVVPSPRHLHRVLTIGRSLAASQEAPPNTPPTSTSIKAWAWSLLPWQDE